MFNFVKTLKIEEKKKFKVYNEEKNRLCYWTHGKGNKECWRMSNFSSSFFNNFSISNNNTKKSENVMKRRRKFFFAFLMEIVITSSSCPFNSRYNGDRFTYPHP